MTKKHKIQIIIAINVFLFICWLVFALNNIKDQNVNYLWQVGLCTLAVVGGFMGMFTSQKWSWLKSEVGRGIFFMSLSIIIWGFSQFFWVLAYYKNTVSQSQIYDVLGLLNFTVVPFMFYGLYELSKATGLKYTLRNKRNVIAVCLSLAGLFVISYYFLVVISRGGLTYFQTNSISTIIFDLGYTLAVNIMLIFALSILVLSWKQLGGKLRMPIFTLLFGFVLVYFADFIFWYYDSKGLYYTGHWVDLIYLLTVSLFVIALCMLEPIKIVPKLKIGPLKNIPNKSNYYSRYL